MKGAQVKGFVIFKHAFLQVFGNFGMAVRLTGPLFIVQSLVGYDFHRRFGAQVTELSLQEPGFWFSWLIVICVSSFVALWIAVAWHRYILLEEKGGRFLPRLRLDRILAYFGVGVMLAVLLTVPFAFALGFIVARFSNPMLILFIALIPLILVFYRLSPVLPAAALGERLKLKDAWEATKPGTGAILVLALIFTGFAVAGAMIKPWVFGASPTVAMVLLPIFDWLYLLLGLSALTTLYGHYIQERDLL